MHQHRKRIEPLWDNVVVEPLEPEAKTPGGLHLPDTARDRPTRGRVVAVGPGRPGPDTGDVIAVRGISVGDVVLYPKYGGTELEIDGRELRVMAASALLAKIV